MSGPVPPPGSGSHDEHAPPGFTAAIFDVDGVLVDSPHEHAWRESLRELMEGPWRHLGERTAWTSSAFSSEVYGRLMSGRPRMSGARAALEHFGIPATDAMVAAYADRKQATVMELIQAGRFRAYPDALRFVLALRASGMRLATASSSRNARLMLEKISLAAFAEDQGLSYEFLRPGTTLSASLDVDVSGRELERGKPDPEIFLAAATERGVSPLRCVVVEDAVAGILAARAGGMAALAVARAGDARALSDADADLVVTSLDDVGVGSLGRGRLRPRDG